MPIYGYRCTQCGEVVEVLQSISDPPLKTCPACMGPLQKQLYPVGVIFKGSGFYTTDYKGSGSRGSSENGSKPEGEKAGTGGEGSSTKSESSGSGSGGSSQSSSGSSSESSGSGKSAKPGKE
jgi:putative FmdB family regulatory protein